MEMSAYDFEVKPSDSFHAFAPSAEAGDLEGEVFPLYSAKPALDEDEEDEDEEDDEDDDDLDDEDLEDDEDDLDEDDDDEELEDDDEEDDDEEDDEELEDDDDPKPLKVKSRA